MVGFTGGLAWRWLAQPLAGCQRGCGVTCKTLGKGSGLHEDMQTTCKQQRMLGGCAGCWAANLVNRWCFARMWVKLEGRLRGTLAVVVALCGRPGHLNGTSPQLTGTSTHHWWCNPLQHVPTPGGAGDSAGRACGWLWSVGWAPLYVLQSVSEAAAPHVWATHCLCCYIA